MVLTRDDLQRAEDGILNLLESSDAPYPPAQLLERLETHGITEYSARVAMWYLIDRNLIELTMDRLLKPVRRGSAETLQQNSVLAGG